MVFMIELFAAGGGGGGGDGGGGGGWCLRHRDNTVAVSTAGDPLLQASHYIISHRMCVSVCFNLLEVAEAE